MDHNKTGLDSHPDITPGQALQQARERLGESRQSVAKKLNVSDVTLVFLENNDYEKLPGDTFVVGYLRNCARLLELEPEALVQLYRNHKASLQPVVAEEETLPVKTKNKSVIRSPILWVILLVTIGWLCYALLSGSEPVDTKAESQAQPVSVVQDTTQDAEPTSMSSADTASPEAGEVELLANDESNVVDGVVDGVIDGGTGGVVAAGESEQLSEPDTAGQGGIPEENSTDLPGATVSPLQDDMSQGVDEVSQESDEVTDEESPVNKVDAGFDELVFEFTAQCWLEITDANGRVLTADLYQADEIAQFQGKAPFKVLIGDVRVAKASLNGVQIELIPDGNRKTLRTQIGG